MLFDSHCHLQDQRIIGQIDAVLLRAAKAGVNGMMCCGCMEKEWPSVKTISQNYPSVRVSYGVHPFYIETLSEQWSEHLQELLLSESGAGVGEIGLDYTITTERALQREVFLVQINLARKLHRPISIHCRNAWGDLLEILKDGKKFFGKALIHSYSGSPELVKLLIDKGLYLSFSGSVCNPANKKAAESLKRVPPGSLLIESDAPDLVPFGTNASINEPAYLPFIAKRVAEIRAVPQKELEAITFSNSEEFCSLF